MTIDASVCYYDSGLFVPMARKTAQGFRSAKYFRPWKSMFPQLRGLEVGEGFPEMERVRDFWSPECYDATDLFVFTDVMDADIQGKIVRDGKLVWGCRDAANLELHRWYFHQTIKKLGLPTLKTERAVGISALREMLKKRPNTWVKMSTFRGNMETWRNEDYDLSRAVVDQLALEFLECQDTVEFIVQDAIEGVEIGIDFYTVDGQYPEQALFGIEIKDCGYCGLVKSQADLPEELKIVNEAMAPLYKKLNYRGFVSTEVRLGKDGSYYYIDPTQRCASPGSELYQEIYTNLPKIMHEGAQGRLIQPDISAPYGVQANIYCKGDTKLAVPVKVDRELEMLVKLQNAYRDESGLDWVLIPHEIENDIVGAVVGFDDSLLGAITMANSGADAVHMDGKDIKMDAISKAVKEMEILAEYGFDVADEMPDTQQIEEVVA